MISVLEAIYVCEPIDASTYAIHPALYNLCMFSLIIIVLIEEALRAEYAKNYFVFNV